jgi:hypothetical protein
LRRRIYVGLKREEALNLACKELRVYTGSSDDVALSFFKNVGFEVLGSARQ